MPDEKLKALLDQNHIKYVTISHSLAFTAQEIAEAAHVPGKVLAKTIIADVDGAMVMAVIPATETLDKDLLRGAVHASDVELVPERDFMNRFPDCEAGAMPPFGNLYNMPVYIDEALSKEPEIIFNAGTHSELIRMAYSDFFDLVKPQVLRLTS